jgi:D-tyrosyl-tRNA(Tyr) deacylase
MIALIQRVANASVSIENQVIASIDKGILALIGIQCHDTESQAYKLADKLIQYRLFADTNGHMNQSIQMINGELLLVPQFTLAADTQKGRRPSFQTAAKPERAEHLFTILKNDSQTKWPRTQAGRFGVDMQINLTNDGPVTFWLNV